MALTAVSSTQRYSLASVPPLTTLIAALTGLDAFSIGMATTITVVSFAVGSPLASRMTHRLSRERILAWGALAVVVACAIRAVPPLSLTLYIGSVVGGLGIAAVATMVPGIIAERLPRLVGPAVGATTFALTLAAVLAASLTAPLAAALGTAGALAFWALPALLCLLVWLPYTRRTTPSPGGRPGLPWRSGTAWLMVLLGIGQNITFLLALTWVTPSYQQQGVPLDTAGFLLGAVTLGNMVGAMSAPLVSRGVATDRRPVLLATLALTAVGGLYLASGSTTGAIAVLLLLGLGLGGGFGVLLALLIDLVDSPRSAAALSAMVFFISNLAGAPSPALGGWIREATGSFVWVWWVVALVSVAQVPIALALGPARRASVRVDAQRAAAPG